MIKCCGCIGCLAKDKKPKPLMTEAEWAEWEAKAEVPEIYDPPQKGCMENFTCCIRISCPCCVPPLRWCCYSNLGVQQGSLDDPDEWFKQLLSQKHPNCPDEFAGIWWLKDNIATEGLFTLADADWETPQLAHKSSRYNWTVDACNLGGCWLTGWFWTKGWRHDFSVSPSRKWVQVTTVDHEPNFVYVIQPGDVFKRPDGSVLDVTPGEDLLRISYRFLEPGHRQITYKYIVRRVAYLDETGALVKTKGYDEVLEVAKATKKACWCPGSLDNHIGMMQAFTPAPPPPTQEVMV